MKLETRRLFIPNLPDRIKEEDVRHKLFKFGNISSIEIRTRKDLGPKHTSYHYAFINIDIDRSSLQECFNEFSAKNWKGHFVDVQLAKESFMERLKKERQEQQQGSNAIQVNNVDSTSEVQNSAVKEIADRKHKRLENGTSESLVSGPRSKEISDSSCSSDSAEESVAKESINTPRLKKTDSQVINGDQLDLVIKNNKFKTHSKTIASVGNAPIIVQSLRNEKKEKSKDPYRKQADQKRLNSMKNMKKGYQEQKSMIQAALSNIDSHKRQKIVFDGNEEISQPPKITVNKTSKEPSKKLSLFNDEEDLDADDFRKDFQLKKQFQGKGGKELFDRQIRFNKDKRFQMDERFLDDEDDGCNQKEEARTQWDGEESDLNVQQESKEQLKIFCEVLGKNFETKSDKPRKTMQRFDPSQPEHAKYELVDEIGVAEKKRRKKNKDADQEAPALPETSKETYYQIDDDLQQVFQQSASFSVLDMLGPSNDNDAEGPNSTTWHRDETPMENIESPAKRKKKLPPGNAFNSIDNETEISNKQDKEQEKSTPEGKDHGQHVQLGPGRLWTESFFFQNDDFRYQEGLDFVKKLQNETPDAVDYSQTRQTLKAIVKRKKLNGKGNKFKLKSKIAARKRLQRLKQLE